MTRITPLLLFLTALHCRQQYEAPVRPENTNVLIVQGFINASGRTNIQLSRTSLLTDTGINYEKNAVMIIESEDNNFYPLLEKTPGNYVSDSNLLNNNTRYRLKIRTRENKNYLSDWAGVINTPLIDSITLTRPGNGLDIIVNAYDLQNNTRYYKWNFTETWEINSVYPSNSYYRIYPTLERPEIRFFYFDTITHARNEAMYRCYNQRVSSAITLGTTIKLSEDRVYQPLVHYNQSSVELSVLYHIRIWQQAMSKEAFAFYDIMRKNTEAVGSVFDAQPSELKGNIHCQENPAELIIGYIDASTKVEKDIFIRNADLPDWNYSMFCYPDIILDISRENIGDESVYDAVHYKHRLSTHLINGTVAAADSICVDCRLRGSPIKPDFWPN